MTRFLPAATALLLAIATLAPAATLKLDETPAGDGQWGYRPADGAAAPTNPPSFSWRPQRGIESWEIECSPVGGHAEAVYRADAIELNVHCPPRTLSPGEHTWRYRGIDAKGNKTNWSRERKFTIPTDAPAMPMPARDELLARIPKSHPRLFVRPEDLPRLRELAQGPLKDRYKELVRQCDRLLAHPPATAEPPKYPADMERRGEDWRVMWWGNREYTIKALDGAATLAFTRLLGGKEEYGQLARRILMDCAKWDPHGATGYRYNDEAGMPYAYHFSRAYTFVYDLLSDDQRQICRQVMKQRMDEMYRHLCPRHLWQPYASHSNRAWHFLGEVGIAFQGEIEGADDAVWFAMNVFYNTYPVWCDDDGGWHEGSSYWSSYVGRFTWWADIMRAAFGIDAYQKPYFARVGYYPMYLMPPGKVGGGFGDLVARRKATDNVPLVSQFAAQAGNGYWQWYAQQMGGPKDTGGYVGFLRGALPKVEPKPPTDLPSSRLFRGTGQAYLNTSILDADQDVQVVFKSSPFGTQSHGYEANNSLLLWAYGQRLLIRTGYRDIYGSAHHRDWMWSTRSVNNITVDGRGQLRHSASARGQITAFHTGPAIDVVVGEAGSAYREKPDAEPFLDRYTRAVLFIKPELVIVYDRLAAREPSKFEYWLHALNEMQLDGQHDIRVTAGDVACNVDFLAPAGLTFQQTNQYDPNPRQRIKLREWHLTASTPNKARTLEFVALYRPHRKGETAPREARLEKLPGGYLLTANLTDGRVTALLPTDDAATLRAEGLETTGRIAIRRQKPDGTVIETVEVKPLD